MMSKWHGFKKKNKWDKLMSTPPEKVMKIADELGIEGLRKEYLDQIVEQLGAQNGKSVV
jgi:hypothetical protein